MKVSTFLMFAGQAREALELYQKAFPGLEVGAVSEHEIADGSTGIQMAELSLAGHAITLSDSSAEMGFSFTPATSVFVNFDSKEEMDSAAEALSEGGEFLMPVGEYGFSQSFGWLKDRFGVSWQVNLP